MCGICGIVGEGSSATVRLMLQAIAHRGPDTFDVAGTGTAWVGGCRLAIRGLVSQPLPHAHGGSVTLFNGEIWNYQDLARELGLDVQQSPDPESAVVHALLACQGWQGVSRLQGMFAIAMTDGETTLLARDRLGIKPLYYALCREGLVFGSEIKALLAHPSVPVTLDEQSLDEIAVFGYVASLDRTPFSAIRQVPPGGVVEVAHGQVKCHTYWQLSPAFSANSEEPLTSSGMTVRMVLESALVEMLEHDPQTKGIYLSGGVDSGLLAILATKLLGPGVPTFTLADSDHAPDLLAARALARVLRTTHHEVRVNLEDCLWELPFFIKHYESVVAGGVFGIHGALAFQLLSREVAKHVRVAFSGEGADELFGGYYWPYTHPLGFVDGIRERLSAIGSPEPLGGLVERLFPQPEDADLYRLRIFDLLLQGGLANHHLWAVDRCSSAFGFEVRPVYLHDNVVRIALALPVEVKVLGEETKRVLKEAARPLYAELGLEHLVDRPKTGMPGALSHIAKELDRVAQNLVSEAHMAQHPFARRLRSPLETVMFDLFYYIFVKNRGMLPSDFDLFEFYRGGTCADMYR